MAGSFHYPFHSGNRELMTSEELLPQIEALPEIELQTLLEGLSDHVHKNKYADVVRGAFNLVSIDELDELSDQLSDLEIATRNRSQLNCSPNNAAYRICKLQSTISTIITSSAPLLRNGFSATTQRNKSRE